MLLRLSPCRRRGASLVEAALVYPIVFLLTFGVVILAMGVYRYQMVAALAREGARWASVHGGQYAQDTGNAMATPSTVFSNAIQPMAVGLDTSQLTYNVSWTNATEMPIFNDASGNPVTNMVTVTVNYHWVPIMYLSPMNMSSTSVMAMQY
jgi:Flp pilus assembly protein TadG